MSPKSPAGVRDAALDGGDDLFGMDHVERVAGDPDRVPAAKAGYIDEGRLGPDRVADIHVDMEGQAGAGQAGIDVNADTVILVIVADHVRGGGLGDELDAVVEVVVAEYGLDELEDSIGEVVQVAAGQVDVLGGSTRV
jgi:hypothetical protein